MAERFANDAYTQLDGAIDDNDTSLTVVDGALFPDEGDFRVRIDDEFLLVTAVAGNIWTVERAVEGLGVAVPGTATAHDDGAEIRHILTAGALANTGGGAPQDRHWSSAAPEAPNAADDEFDEPTMDPKWTRVKHTTVTKANWDLHEGMLSYQQIAAAGNEMDVWVQPSTIAVGDYVQMGFRFSPNATWFSAAVGFSDTTVWNTGTQVMAWVHWSGSTYRSMLNTYVGFQNRTQDGSFWDNGITGSPYHVRVKYEAANTWGIYTSPNGKQWATLQTNYSRTMTPAYVFIGAAFLNPVSATLNIVDFFYFRKNPG